jgi:4-amino-4-deoxy-L-arabinose transferase-like glycosyltransferase
VDDVTSRARGVHVGGANDGWWAALAALVVRVAFLIWAARVFPAAADGTYYDTIARRIAQGHGYTWLWDDGTVTYAAHYPIGYPALVAPFYLVLGAHPLGAMIVNTVAAAFATLAIHRLASPLATRRFALLAALAAGLHPALVPYVAAVMTEGVTAALLCVAAALAMGKTKRRVLLGALVLGVAILVRPQSLLLAPVLGVLAVPGGLGRRVLAAALVTSLSIAVCLPWTARNCVRMHRCALVSVNAGWNLLIGEATESGGWQPIDVPSECTAVFDEAEKDRCFERAARERILAHPMRWLGKATRKLGVTFDYFGGAPWYLHESNPIAFPVTAKVWLAVLETVASRAFLLGAIVVAATRSAESRPEVLRHAFAAIAVVASAFALTPHASFVAYALLALLLLAATRWPWRPAEMLLPWTSALIVATAVTHAVFFGAGRYGLVVAPFVAAVSLLGRRSPIPPLASESLIDSSSSD